MIQDKAPISLPLCEIKTARKAAKVTKEAASKHIGCHVDRLTRFETGQQLAEIEDLARLYGYTVVLVKTDFWGKLGQIMAILGQKVGKMGE